MNSVRQPVAAPGEVADDLGHLDHAEVLAGRVDDPDAAGPGHPDVAALVALHTVGRAVVDLAVADVAEEQPAVRQRAVGADVVHPDPRVRRVVDVEQRLVRREAEPVGHLELVLADDQLELTAGRDHVHALEAELALALDAEHRHPPVPRVAEVDRPVRAGDHVVGAVELLAAEVRRDRLALVAAVSRTSEDVECSHTSSRPSRVVDHAVALVGRPHDLRRRRRPRSSAGARRRACR